MLAHSVLSPATCPRVGRGVSRRGQLVVTNVATPNKPPASRLARRSKVEVIKENSDFLRHPLMQDLVDDQPMISEDSIQLMKFHGSYQQDDREKRTRGAGKVYQFMMRTRQPAGLVSNELYLTMDDLADQYGNGTLRLTTREAFQLHGVLKQDLKTVFSSVVKAMGSTLGACGDVNRNVIAPPLVDRTRKEYAVAAQLAEDIADLLAPQSGAYYDVWLDGEKFMSMERENPKVTKDRAFNKFGTNIEGPEPIYGPLFLPRKFKTGVTVPGDNHIDLLTNDLGVVVISDDKGEWKGCNIYVGGGLGRTHRNEDTFAAIASPLGYVDKEDVFHVVKAIIATQRDYGRRDDRRQARLKYLVHQWGVDRFRSVVEQYMGKKMEPFVPLPAWEYKDYLGWGEHGDGKLYWGLYVQNGRVKGEAKKALREVIEGYDLPVIITANQNLILTDINPADKDAITKKLSAAGLRDRDDWDAIELTSMACPALPLCGLAVTEAERTLPDVNAAIRATMTRVGLPEDEPLIVRMTGCPNGCARPYMAEVGFVGDGPNSYQLYLGGSPNATRLADVYEERVKHGDITSTLEPLFAYWSQSRRTGESFGDFCGRIGFDGLRSFAESYEPSGAPAKAAAAAAAPANGNGKAAAPAKAKAAPAATGGSTPLESQLTALLQEAAAKGGKTPEQVLADLLKKAAQE
ncbi:unnamed protein product [Pedinophyceae sp. YPF-701]|nr:unnamed protein product [Pedinophyceae sp. YPF-701]